MNGEVYDGRTYHHNLNMYWCTDYAVFNELSEAYDGKTYHNLNMDWCTNYAVFNELCEAYDGRTYHNLNMDWW